MSKLSKLRTVLGLYRRTSAATPSLPFSGAVWFVSGLLVGLFVPVGLYEIVLILAAVGMVIVTLVRLYVAASNYLEAAGGDADHE